MGKVYTITMGHCPSRIWKQSVDAYYKNSIRKTEHVFVDSYYPINQDENRRDLWEICRTYGISVIDPGKNLGGAEAFNYALRRLPLAVGDIIIGYDPDSCPISNGFDGALVDAILMDSKVNWSSLMSERAKPELQERGYTKKTIGHIEAWKTHRPVVNSICAFRAEWLLGIGGFRQDGKIYGGLEAALFSHLRGGEWVFLPNWAEVDSIRDQQDVEYLWWKWKFAHLREFSGTFSDYVAAGCPAPSDLPERLP